MLGGLRLKVGFIHEKTCFAYISPKYSTNNEQSQCVQVLSKDKQLLLWVVYSSNVPEGQVACNPVYSKLVGLEEGATVFVAPYADVKVLDELYVDTDSPDDQEILEHNVELLQLRILDQLRLVVANQKTVVWISASLPIVFTPKQTGILVNSSRIIVKIDAFNSMHGSFQPLVNIPKDTENSVKFTNIGIINDGMLRPYLNVPKKLVLRAVPIDSDGKKNLIHPYTVFIHEDLIDNKYKDSIVVLATMNNIPSIIQENNEEDGQNNNNNKINDICVEIVPIDSVIFRSLCREVYNKNIPTALIPKSLNAIVNVDNGMRIMFTLIGDTLEQPDHIDVITYSEQVLPEADIIERFKECVISNTHSGKKFLINSGVLKYNAEISSGCLQLKLKPDKLKYTMLNSESFRHCSISAQCLNDTELQIAKPKATNIEYDYKNYCRTVKSVESLVDIIVSHLCFEIHREASFKGASEIKSNILVTGLCGTGKSSLCHIVQKELTVWSHIVHCRSLKGRKDIPEVLGKAILICQEHSPSVLICDDVDSLVPPNVEGASPQDIAYYQRLAVVIKHSLQSCSGVCVLMTSLSVKALHPTLRQFSGKPLFTAHFDIPELGQEERIELFKHLVNDKVREQFEVNDDDVIKLAMDTGGSSVRDITDYFNKAIFKAVKKKKANADDPRPRLVEDITKDVEKANAFDIWGPVGGLDDVKQQLTECIFWPIMEERIELFKHLVNDKVREQFEVNDDDVIKLAMDTGGSSVRDITDYFNKAIFKAVKKKKANADDPRPRLVEDITKDVEKANAFDIWGPVGGLDDVKQQLTECIFWPIMYPALFPSQSCGILVYGPPGTGKSHVGSCLARLANVNMITVKGPELLSKYIGQSEKAVRDVFDKADMKRPCILFFDEFDSLAPKRGHDSTGVTDRVVNQLLARLDGAEGGARGPVIAATSRPDLVDPALLRAGRLQRHIYCALPDQRGRYEVLQTLSKSVTMNEDVSLQDLAEVTEGFSPADLKSLLVTAQLTRLETQLINSQDKNMESVVVGREDLQNALEETKPSLSKEQRLFYDVVYKRFRGETLSPEQRVVSSEYLKQRVTLA